MSPILTIADAVVAGLNAETFTPAFTAVRRYQPVFELPELHSLQVSVVPRSLTVSAAARDSGYFDCVIDVAVQRKVDPDDPAELDALMNLVAQLVEHLYGRRLPDAPQAAWVSIANEPIFAPEHLEQWRQFTSVLSVTYRVRSGT